MRQGKAFEIPKALVWLSYLDVKRNRGAPGVDGQTISSFDQDRERNLYKIWNRLCSGSYFPPPVREKRIPKDNGKERILGIPTVADRVAQGAVKLFMEERLDPLFHQDSYGYRPNKSAHHALQSCMERCWRYSWVLEVDISTFFDTVRHDLVVKALEHHQMPRWVILYCTRWLEAPIQAEGGDSPLEKRTIGTPQGGVISPLLANLFLHYAFDQWMVREHRFTPFERYADDIVCHCSYMRDAVKLKHRLTKRFAELGLFINKDKSKVVYIDTFTRRNVDTCFTFLGYDFKVRTLKNYKGELYRKCMPGASMKAMKRITKTIRGWRIHRSTADNIKEFAVRYNATVRGWITYYGKFWYRNFSHRLWSVMQSRLLKWAQRKFRLSTREAQRRLNQLQRERPTLFPHWYLLRASNV
ncbi:MAG: group II intron reverse transcriptase/maturase [Gammaproteobacteria bacterium]|nr:group II intron reverse transcriptase/maturase [Gammaproteobacteria bacterium]MBJ55907.1 group II intron reverse transcriptase/maturase [Gammaproteobacteria bacterium]HBN15301.1 group II intron reverse transcriptase/maturase [Pseudohongiella sp.]|tara:strand:+ start:254 stop:1492 length:1239 start_codon:yes stop_codon:yes gene_type:complete